MIGARRLFDGRNCGLDDGSPSEGDELVAFVGRASAHQLPTRRGCRITGMARAFDRIVGEIVRDELDLVAIGGADTARVRESTRPEGVGPTCPSTWEIVEGSCPRGRAGLSLTWVIDRAGAHSS